VNTRFHDAILRMVKKSSQKPKALLKEHSVDFSIVFGTIRYIESAFTSTRDGMWELLDQNGSQMLLVPGIPASEGDP
jgi:hypothetical protein